MIVDVQRAGPSTGLPTKTEQADLNMALFGRHGEAPVAVVAAAVPRRLLPRRDRGLPDRAEVPHPGHPAVGRLRRQRLRAVAAARGQRAARPAASSTRPAPTATTASSTRTCATRRRWRGRGPCPARRGWSTASAAWRRPTRPVTSPTTRPTTTSWCAPGPPASRRSTCPTSRSRTRRARRRCWCWAGARRTARSARRARALRQRGVNVAQAHLRHLNPLPKNLGEVLASLRQGGHPGDEPGPAGPRDPGALPDRRRRLQPGARACPSPPPSWRPCSRK